jgi:GxxExxY protein
MNVSVGASFSVLSVPSVVNIPMTDNELTHEIIGAAIEVHKNLGPGLLESTHEECLCHELSQRGIPFERQKPIPVVYKGVKLDCGYRPDLLVADRVILELKSVETLAPIHDSIMITYLKLSGHRIGLLMSFNVQILKEGIKRLVA